MRKFHSERGIQSIPLAQMYDSFFQLSPCAQKGSLRYAMCSGEGVSKNHGTLLHVHLCSSLDYSISKKVPLSKKVFSSGHYRFARCTHPSTSNLHQEHISIPEEVHLMVSY